MANLLKITINRKKSVLDEKSAKAEIINDEKVSKTVIYPFYDWIYRQVEE